MGAARKLDLVSEPKLFKFSPDVIPWQREVIDYLDEFDYESGVPEVLLSGSYGSAKSVLVAHLAVVHCLENPRAVCAIGRRARPDLRETLWLEILEHIEEELEEGVDYKINYSRMSIRFANGSKIISVSWADGRFSKFRSLKISMLVIEELTENDSKDKQAFMSLKARLGRLPHVKRNVFIGATNPDAPSHWAYTYFIEPNQGGKKHPTRRVFYSLTEQNPFLPKWYVPQLLNDLDAKEARRYLRGEWIELVGEVIYGLYNSEAQFVRKAYELNPSLPIHISFDFNIGLGKPMSSCMFQYDPSTDIFHVFAEVVIEGARTAQVIEEYDELGLIKPTWKYVINGDSAGKNRDTRSSRSDYEIIIEELGRRGIGNPEYAVPPSNPPLRTRHNTVNVYCKNAAGRVRLFVYENCPTVDKGLRLTQLVKTGNYVEDDSPKHPYQHVTTALGYGVCFTLLQRDSMPQAMRRL